jgi:hypothetical protein
VLLRHGPEVLVVDGDLAAHPAEHRCHADVRPVEHDDGRSLAAQPLDPDLEPGGDFVGVRAWPDDIVATHRDRDQVGVQLERGLDLLVEDLLEQPPAHGEVGVGEVVGLITEDLGDTVGPSAMTAGRAGLRIADPFGEGVADRDIA